MKAYDAIVIGAGPAGMTAALYLARFGLKLALVEKMTPGGMLLQTYAIENYPGHSSARGYELADAMADQLDAYSFDRFTGDVVSFEANPGNNRIKVGDDELAGRTVIICAGLHHQKLGLPDEEKLTGHGVSYCALCDGNFFRGQVVGVVGGGNSALEEALYLSTLVKELHLFHRRDEFRADKILQDKIRAASNVTLHMNTVVSALRGDTELTGVMLKSTLSGEEQLLPLNGLFIFAGLRPAADFLPAGLNMDKDNFLITDTEMRTNLPGIFAAGDIRSKLCRQVATAVGDGATAATAARAYLDHANA